jgi:hydrogenase maturation protease
MTKANRPPSLSPQVTSQSQTQGDRVLVAGVGYENLRDLSAGPIAVASLSDLGAHVDVEDLSYGALDVRLVLERRARYRLMVLIAAAPRGDSPGTIRRERWLSPPIAPVDLQVCINEALTGVIDHVNLLHILTHFDALPDSVIVYEIEPQDQGWGEGTTTTVAAAIDRVRESVRDLVARPVHA